MMMTIPSRLTVDGRELAILRQDGTGPELVWLGGFRSEMTATKAGHLAGWAARTGRAITRFDYSGHGQSSGRFEDGTIGVWLEDALGVIAALVRQPAILVGSSMGGWLALLAAQRLRATSQAPVGLVLIAPAPDFTERLLWPELSDEARGQINREGVWNQPSDYASEPTPITRTLIEDGRRHLVLDAPLDLGCPVHILQGMADPDVPWSHAMTLVEHLAGDDVVLTLIKDGDHRLSRPADLDKIVEAVEGLV